jgi:hypothetical protein
MLALIGKARFRRRVSMEQSSDTKVPPEQQISKCIVGFRIIVDHRR